MFTLYLACLIFGGLLLSFTLFLGGHSHVDTHLDFDSHADVDLHPELSGHADTHLEAGGQDSIGSTTDHTTTAEGRDFVFRYFSFRNLILFCAFFGLTGTLLSLEDQVPAWLTLVTASVLGFFSASLGHKAMQYLQQHEVSTGNALELLEGMPAKIFIGVKPGKMGKISISTPSQNIQLMAQIAAESEQKEFKYGDEAIIVRIQDGIADIAEKDFLQLNP